MTIGYIRRRFRLAAGMYAELARPYVKEVKRSR